MKLVKSLIIILAIFCSAFHIIDVKANTKQSVNVNMEFENGFLVETIIIEDTNNSRASQKSGTKSVNYYNGDSLLWSVSVHGTFSYDGNSSSCISSTVSASSYNSYWEISNKSAWRNGSTAYASATGVRYFLGLPLQTINRDVYLNCNPSGILS